MESKVKFKVRTRVLPLMFSVVTVAATQVVLSTHAAEGGMSFGVVGAATLQNPQVEDSGTERAVDGKVAYGGGITTEFVLSPGSGLEIDLLYLSHKFSRDTSDVFGSEVSSTFTSGYLHVPVLFRIRPIPLINLGAGGYYSRILSAWNVSAEGFGDATFDYGKNDFGFVLALGTLIPLNSNLALVGDLRYARSLTDSARESGDALKFADIQALVGVRFGAW